MKNNKWIDWVLCVLLVVAIFAVNQTFASQTKVIKQQQEQIVKQQQRIQELEESCENWYQLVEEIKNDK